MKKCPFCAEKIKDEAIKCKHCGEWLNGKNDDNASIEFENEVLENESSGKMEDNLLKLTVLNLSYRFYTLLLYQKQLQLCSKLKDYRQI